jgi:DNA-binding transcriptional ArsR family regulator
MINVGFDTDDSLSGCTMTFDQRKEDMRMEDKARKEEEERAKKSPYQSGKWYQMNGESTKCLMALIDNQPAALKILLFLLQHMDTTNSLVVSYVVLQEFLGLSRATVGRSIKYLKDHNYITVYKSGTSNIYVVNDTIAWKSYGKNIKYSKFNATVILSASEQSTDCKIRMEKHKEIIVEKQPEESQ